MTPSRTLAALPLLAALATAVSFAGAKVTVRSDLPATVVVDGKAVGQTPLQVNMLYAGERKIEVLHKARPADPTQPVLVAGDPEMETRKERLATGVPVPDDLRTQLREVAKRAGVPFVLAP